MSGIDLVGPEVQERLRGLAGELFFAVATMARGLVPEHETIFWDAILRQASQLNEQARQRFEPASGSDDTPSRFDDLSDDFLRNCAVMASTLPAEDEILCWEAIIRRATTFRHLAQHRALRSPPPTDQPTRE